MKRKCKKKRPGLPTFSLFAINLGITVFKRSVLNSSLQATYGISMVMTPRPSADCCGKTDRGSLLKNKNVAVEVILR